MPADAASSVCGVLTDIDDRLTTDGDITVGALQALQALRDAGLSVISARKVEEASHAFEFGIERFAKGSLGRHAA